jgi:hypothetical protein
MHDKVLQLCVSHQGIEKFRTWILESELVSFLLEMKKDKYNVISFNKDVDLRVLKEENGDLISLHYNNIKIIILDDLI